MTSTCPLCIRGTPHPAPGLIHIDINIDLLDMLRSLVSRVSYPHLGQGIGCPLVYFNPFLLTWSSQKQIYNEKIQGAMTIQEYKSQFPLSELRGEENEGKCS